MRVVFLVPWRTSEDRMDIAAYTFNHLAGYGWPIHACDRPGDWNRAASINGAAADAGAWDIAVIADADTLHEPGILEDAVGTVAKDGGAVVPWQLRHKLSEVGTARMVAHGLQGFKTVYADIDHRDWTPNRMSVLHSGGTIVVHRDAWDAVSGMDEGFSGWGHEDVAFRVSLRALSRLRSQKGTIWHLWHPRHRASTENEERKALYMAAQNNPDRLRELLAGRSIR